MQFGCSSDTQPASLLGVGGRGRLGKVGAVVVHYHRESEVAALVHDLVVHQGLFPEHVVVVNNGSSGQRLAAEFARVGVSPTVSHQRNIGYAAGMNEGVRLLPSHIDALVFLTHEVKLDHLCVEHLIDVLDSDHRIGLVGPMLLTPEGRVWSAGGELSPVRRLPKHRLQGASPTAAPNGLSECAWLDGAVTAMRRTTWNELGGLDERYFLYLEDVDFGMRVRRCGRSVVVAPWVCAEQQPSLRIPDCLWTRNPFLFFRVHGMWLAWLLWMCSILAGLLRDLVTGRGAGHSVRLRFRALVSGVRGRGGRPPPGLAHSSSQPMPRRP